MWQIILIIFLFFREIYNFNEAKAAAINRKNQYLYMPSMLIIDTAFELSYTPSEERVNIYRNFNYFSEDKDKNKDNNSICNMTFLNKLATNSTSITFRYFLELTDRSHL